ncbi:TPA: thioredoxin, partial [Candidatus Bathyarchaeota archaeon]|nr:thioredoxin [Candidatus Bathyarchaeota archaeon]
ELKRRHPDVPFEMVDVDRHPDLAARHGVESVPAVIVVRDGDVMQRFTGPVQRARVETLIDLGERVESFARLTGTTIRNSVLRKVVGMRGRCPCRPIFHCPCPLAAKDILRAGSCYCGLFKRAGHP